MGDGGESWETAAAPSPAIKGWDVGERPNVRMAHIEYPSYEFSKAAIRDADQVQSVQQTKAVQLERIDARTSRGWASAQRQIYQPLGSLEELPAQGSDLRTKRGVDVPRPVVVMPGHNQAVLELAMARAATPLMADTKVWGQVSQFQYRYYSIKVHERLSLTINVEKLQGDPDVFVSMECNEPTREDHTWKSDGGGSDVVYVSTDHPSYALGATL